MRFAIRPLSANIAPAVVAECPKGSGCEEDTVQIDQPPCEQSQEAPPEPQPEISGCHEDTLRPCDEPAPERASAAKRAIRAQMARAARRAARTGGRGRRR